MPRIQLHLRVSAFGLDFLLITHSLASCLLDNSVLGSVDYEHLVNRDCCLILSQEVQCFTLKMASDEAIS